MIKNIPDFMSVIQKFNPNNETAFFRGQSSNKFNVSSSLARAISSIGITQTRMEEFSRELAKMSFIEFKRNMVLYPESNLFKNYNLNEFEFLATGQHYGLSTRLIDWTKNPLIALYFATEDEKNTTPSVYMIINSDKNKIFHLNSEAFTQHIKDSQKELERLFALIKEHSFSFSETEKIRFSLSIDCHPPQINCTDPRLQSSGIHLNEGGLRALYSSLGKEAEAFIKQGNRNKTFNFSATNARFTENIFENIASLKIFDNNRYIIEALPTNNRLKNQQGVFMYTNKINEAIIDPEEIPKSNIIRNHTQSPDSVQMDFGTIRIDIDKSQRKNILAALSLHGITKNFIYPELPYYTKALEAELKEKLKKKYPLHNNT